MQVADIPSTAFLDLSYERKVLESVDSMRSRSEEEERRVKETRAKLGEKLEGMRARRESQMKSQQEEAERKRAEEERRRAEEEERRRVAEEMKRVMEEKRKQEELMRQKREEEQRRRAEEERRRQEQLLAQQRRLLTMVEKGTERILPPLHCNAGHTIGDVIGKLGYDRNKFLVNLFWEGREIKNERLTLGQYGIPDNAALYVEVVDLEKVLDQVEEDPAIPCEKCNKLIPFTQYSTHITTCK